jgi:hypothetical protein
VIINELVAAMFMISYPLYGFAVIRTATLPRWCGILLVHSSQDEPVWTLIARGRKWWRVNSDVVRLISLS